MSPAGAVTVRVPASSANLGPGFDVMAAALELHTTVTATTGAAFAVRTGLDVPADRTNLVVRAFASLRSVEDVAFDIASEIPLSGGLGSSAAAIVAGLSAAAALAGGPHDADDLYRRATQLEGHPDNVAAALYGGIVVCGPGDAVHRIAPPGGLTAVLVVPDKPVRTAQARAALPDTVELADAVHNVAAASALTLGLATADLRLVAAGLSDRLHQPHRAHLYPLSAALVQDATTLGALGATISGAGPTVLVWCETARAETVAAALRERVDGWAAVLTASLAADGARVL